MKKLVKTDYIKIYSYMLKIRRFEERAAQGSLENAIQRIDRGV